MAKTTKWVDQQNKTLDELIATIMSNNLQEIQQSYSNISKNKLFPENQEISLNDKKIYFNYIDLSFDKIIDTTITEDNTVKNEIFILIYNDGVKNNYILNKNSEALRLLRILLKCEGKGEIIAAKTEITSDFIIWLISRVYLSDCNFSVNDDEGIEIDSIMAFKGKTEDQLSTVSASGDSIINILSTLSFLLESTRLNNTNIRLTYGKHDNIEIKIDTNGTVDIDEKKYLGLYDKGLDIIANKDKCLRAKLLLLIYIEVLPILRQWYNTSVKSDEWNQSTYTNFLSKVAEDLTLKVDCKIKTLEEVNPANTKSLNG